MRRTLFVLAGLCLLATAARAEENRPVMRAVKAKTPPVIDGVLDDEVWKTAPVYRLELPLDRRQTLFDIPLSGGKACFAWDEEMV